MSETERKTCPDCNECRMCSSSRCSLCKRDGRHRDEGTLGPCFSHRRFLEWKREKN